MFLFLAIGKIFRLPSKHIVVLSGFEVMEKEKNPLLTVIAPETSKMHLPSKEVTQECLTSWGPSFVLIS